MSTQFRKGWDAFHLNWHPDVSERKLGATDDVIDDIAFAH